MIELLNNNLDNVFINNTLKLYSFFTTENFPKNIQVPFGFENLIKLIYKKHNIEQPCIKSYKMTDIINVPINNRDVIVGFSGGLDSVYLALKLRHDNYNVILYHLTGLNKNYPKEDEFAKEFAKQYNFTYINNNIKHSQKEFFIDNPLKNQFILACMIDYGIKNQITQFALGIDECTDISNATIGMTITDSNEVNLLYWQGVKTYFTNAQLLHIDNKIKKINRLQFLLSQYPDSIKHIYSCITPHRFNNMLHNNNNDKYKINLLPGRCGSCFKCCMEILLLTELGYYNYDDKLIKHCWDILANSKNTHRKDLFNKTLNLEIRRNNLLNYGS